MDINDIKERLEELKNHKTILLSSQEHEEQEDNEHSKKNSKKLKNISSTINYYEKLYEKYLSYSKNFKIDNISMKNDININTISYPSIEKNILMNNNIKICNNSNNEKRKGKKGKNVKKKIVEKLKGVRNKVKEKIEMKKKEKEKKRNIAYETYVSEEVEEEELTEREKKEIKEVMNKLEIEIENEEEEEEEGGGIIDNPIEMQKSRIIKMLRYTENSIDEKELIQSEKEETEENLKEELKELEKEVEDEKKKEKEKESLSKPNIEQFTCIGTWLMNNYENEFKMLKTTLSELKEVFRRAKKDVNDKLISTEVEEEGKKKIKKYASGKVVVSTLGRNNEIKKIIFKDLSVLIRQNNGDWKRIVPKVRTEVYFRKYDQYQITYEKDGSKIIHFLKGKRSERVLNDKLETRIIAYKNGMKVLRNKERKEILFVDGTKQVTHFKHNLKEINLPNNGKRLVRSLDV